VSVQSASSTGLTTRTASVLSYLGWFVTGLIFWSLEREDRLVRFHAIQSTVAFGVLGLAIALAGLAALLMLSFAPGGFTVFMGIAFVLWVVSLVLWLLAIWKASQGVRWRIPLASRLADSWTREDSVRAEALGPGESPKPKAASRG
jgi:uncharacterized membrane protein